jgi:hypothetical protein
VGKARPLDPVCREVLPPDKSPPQLLEPLRILLVATPQRKAVALIAEQAR